VEALFMIYDVHIPRCAHIKTNGTQCGCPSLRERRFCYFHEKWQGQQIALKAEQPPEPSPCPCLSSRTPTLSKSRSCKSFASSPPASSTRKPPDSSFTPSRPRVAHSSHLLAWVGQFERWGELL